VGVGVGVGPGDGDGDGTGVGAGVEDDVPPPLQPVATSTIVDATN